MSLVGSTWFIATCRSEGPVRAPGEARGATSPALVCVRCGAYPSAHTAASGDNAMTKLYVLLLPLAIAVVATALALVLPVGKALFSPRR